MDKKEFMDLYYEYLNNGFEKMDIELKNGSTIIHNPGVKVHFLEDILCIVDKGLIVNVSYSEIERIAI